MSTTAPTAPHALAHHAAPQPQSPPSLTPLDGWHVQHLYYRLRRDVLQAMSADQRAAGRQECAAALNPQAADAPPRLQTLAVMGNKADFGVLLMGPDPLQLDRVRAALHATALGPALEPTYSFVSLTEVSEYVPTVEQYAERLKEEGNDPGSDAFQAKLKVYETRETKMRAQRLYPEIPPWPSTCFYPMSKKREVGENWFLLDYDERMRLMTHHGKLGQTFAGKVVQLITASTGLDDWEWGVTLWAHNPGFLKEVVYRMRFDEASARYALFGPFYQGYVLPTEQLLQHLHV